MDKPEEYIWNVCLDYQIVEKELEGWEVLGYSRPEGASGFGIRMQEQCIMRKRVIANDPNIP